MPLRLCRYAIRFDAITPLRLLRLLMPLIFFFFAYAIFLFFSHDFQLRHAADDYYRR